MIRRETMKNNFDYIGKINEMITEENIECEEFWDYCKRYICYIGRTIIKKMYGIGEMLFQQDLKV